MSRWSRAIQDAGLEACEVSNVRTGIIMGSADRPRAPSWRQPTPPAPRDRSGSDRSRYRRRCHRQPRDTRHLVQRSRASTIRFSCLRHLEPLHRQRLTRPFRSGKQDIIFAGVCEELDWSLWCCSTRWARCPRNTTIRPATAIPPLPRQPRRFVIAGGAGVVVLEELNIQSAWRARLRRNRRLRRHLRRLRYGRAIGRWRRALHGGWRWRPWIPGSTTSIARDLDAGRRSAGKSTRSARCSAPATSAPRFPRPGADRPFARRHRRAGGDLFAIDDEQRLYLRKRPISRARPVFADMPIVRKRIDNAKLGTVLSNPSGLAAPTPRWCSNGWMREICSCHAPAKAGHQYSAAPVIIATLRITGSPAFAGDDIREMSGAHRR